MTTIRPPPRKKKENRPSVPPWLPMENMDGQMLRAVAAGGFKLRRYVIVSGYNRSTEISRMGRLISKGFVFKPNLGSWAITDSGKEYLKAIETGSKGGVDGSRAGGRRGGALSQHANRYSAKYICTKSLEQMDFSQLHPMEVKRHQMINWWYWIVYLDAATITVSPHKVVIVVEEVIANNLDDTSMQSFNKALKIIDELDKLGIVCEGLKLEYAEYERIKSQLSNVLFKKLGHYEVKLSSGRSFWIDGSDGVQNDESNSPQLRANLDDFITELEDYPFSPKEFEHWKKISENLLKIELLKHVPIKNQEDQRRPDYLG